MPTQEIRRSQFITTFGPGSIIEGRNGPAIILMPEIGLFRHLKLVPSDFEIKSPSLSRIIGGEIFEIPSKQKLGDYDKPVYRTKVFPEWHLCPPNSFHNEQSILYKGSKCRRCGNSDHRNAVRFVMACPCGHLDDVDWEKSVHKLSGSGEKCGRISSGEPYFSWIRWGPTLWNIRIVCAFCKAETTMGRIFYEWHECRGRFPDMEEPYGRHMHSKCKCDDERIQYEEEHEEITPKRKMPHVRMPQVLHRGALNLRMPEILSAVKIPLLHGGLPALMTDERIRSTVLALDSVGRLDMGSLAGALRGVGVEERLITALTSSSLEDIRSALRQSQEYRAPTTQDERLAQYNDMKTSELRALKTVASEGPLGISPEDLDVSLSDAEHFETDGSMKVIFRVTPVTRLKVVMTQTGYRRVDPAEGRLVPVEYVERMSHGRNRSWQMGVELKGEGIFIDIETPTNFKPLGTAAAEWSSLNDGNRSQGGKHANHASGFLNNGSEKNPLFIWWHSFAHKLLTWIAIDSGYSAASLSERVYCDGNSGGALIYTSQPGGDGSLGGLIGLVDRSKHRFQNIIKNSYLSASSCSNDPFCSETSVVEGSYAGAACYVCAFLPETSCEHRNLWLDRRLLVQNPLFREWTS